MEQHCQRCERELPATHHVESEIISLDVCDACAAEAFGLPQTAPGRLSVMPLSRAA